jgi:4a-hydroxytetrahydrobiopterin dehydratase
MRTPRLTELETALNALPDWTLLTDSKQIQRRFVFPNFTDAIAFVNSVAEAAESLDHHPDMDIRWNCVTLTLTTHDSGGLTRLDFELAAQINAAAEMLG